MANGNGNNGLVVKILMGISSGAALLWIGWVSNGVANSASHEAKVCDLEKRTVRLETAMEQVASMKVDIAVIKSTMERWDKDRKAP